MCDGSENVAAICDGAVMVGRGCDVSAKNDHRRA